MKLIYERYDSSIKPLSKSYLDDAGIDLQAFGTEQCPCDPSATPSALLKDPITILPSTQKVFTGIKIFIPSGYFGLITPRSSARNYGMICQSIIDSGYTGWLMPFMTFTQSYQLYPGDRLFQLIIVKLADVVCGVGDVSSISSIRGIKGGGSTGR